MVEKKGVMGAVLRVDQGINPLTSAVKKYYLSEENLVFGLK